MRQQVAVRRHTLQEAPGIGRAPRDWSRPLGRRLLMLVALACTGVLAVAASSAQAAGLPDGRAYEQVTPANKDNGDPYLRAGIFGGYQAAATGDAFTFPSLYGFPGSPSERHLVPVDPRERAAGALPTRSHRSRPSRARCAPPSPARSAGPPTCPRTLWSTAQTRPPVAETTIRCSRREPPRADFRCARRRRS